MEEKRETGNKICVVDRNNTTYSKEISKGAFPIHQSISRSNNIVLDSDPSNIYGKVLETSYPPAADNWYNWETRSKKSKKKSKGKVIKGMHKWKDYPELIEVSSIFSEPKLSIKSFLSKPHCWHCFMEFSTINFIVDVVSFIKV